MHEAVIVASGPTGLLLGGKLALAGIDVVMVERRLTSELVHSRAGGFHWRALEALRQRGMVTRLSVRSYWGHA